MGNTIGEFFKSILGIQPSSPQAGASNTAPKADHPVDRFTAVKDQIAGFGEKYASSGAFSVQSIFSRSSVQLCEKAEGALERCAEYYDLDNPSMNGRFQSFLGEAYHSEFPS